MNDFDFTGQTAIVTGGASGIGKATAIKLAQRGCAVHVFDVALESAEAWVKQEGLSAVVRLSKVDIAHAHGVHAAVQSAVDASGRLDLLCHCAGIQSYGTAETTTTDAWSKTMAVDLDSAFFLAHAALPFMKAQRSGSIVLTASTQSLVAHRNSAAYVTGKHGLLGIMRSIAVDFGRFGIRCNAVLPGAIDTPMIRWGASRESDPEAVLQACHSLALLGRMGLAEEIANVNLFLLSGLASFITGAAIVADGGQLVPCGGTAFQNSGTGGAD